VLREQEDATALRTTIGVDRRFAPGGKDLYVIAEYQHDGLAAAGPDEYVQVLGSKPFLRGELQVLGRDELVLQGTYQLHPLWNLAGLVLWNLNDASVLLSPSVAYSASDSATVSGGAFFGFGDDEITDARPLPSEYGLAAVTAYASVSVYF
jgi:hypothetical protein